MTGLGNGIKIKIIGEIFWLEFLDAKKGIHLL
jgi:hypothetical protein